MNIFIDRRLKDYGLQFGPPGCRFTLRWIGLRGECCAFVRETFPQGTVTRIWFGGLLLKAMVKRRA